MRPLRYLNGRTLFPVPAEAGHNHIEHVRVGDLPHAKEVKVIQLFPGRSTNDKGLDVSDYLDQYTPDELVELIGAGWFQQSVLTDPVRERKEDRKRGTEQNLSHEQAQALI
jgi:hypothetical protein